MWPVSLRFEDAVLPDPAAHLARDLACLDAVEADPAQAMLRCWESPDRVVIVGRSNDLAREVHVERCAAEGVAIHRRASGGGAVMLGPGCLCFTLALPIPAAVASLGIAGVTRAVMQRLAEGLSTDQSHVLVRGISDLVLGERKISGSAQRWRKRAFLHHGTLLYDFDVAQMERYLAHPSQEPEYRQHRPHRDFLANLPWTRQELIGTLRRVWQAGD